MKRLDLILNGKGGVGKSFFAVSFIQFLKDRGIAHVAIDSDNENSTLKRFHPETRFLDLGNRREMDAIFTALEKPNLVVVDCRAASTDLFGDHHGGSQTCRVQPARSATASDLATEALRRNRIGGRPVVAHEIASLPAMDARHFADEFEEAVAQWRVRHRLTEDDAVLLLVELFRLHQRHWDELRRRELPSFEQFRSDIAKLVEAARTFRTDSAALLEILRSQRRRGAPPRVSLAVATVAVILALLAGWFIGKALP